MSAAPSGAAMVKYREMTQEIDQLMSKINELETDRNEHKLVEETLEPLDPNRRAYRLVGGVLVERTVKEVLPSVKTNRENLDTLVKNLQERLEGKQKEAAAYRAEHNLPTEQGR